jgi:hypothetical protein
LGIKCHLGTKVPRKKHRLEVFANRGAAKNIWISEGGSGRRLEKTGL